MGYVAAQVEDAQVEDTKVEEDARVGDAKVEEDANMEEV
jgi:hypothetical protein